MVRGEQFCPSDVSAMEDDTMEVMEVRRSPDRGKE